MDLNRAMVFARVVEAKGFSAAARQLGIPKASVSKKIADLEAELGIRLLNRTTRSVAATEAGLRLYQHCVEAIRQLAVGEREVRALQQAPQGMLTIAAPGAIAVNFLLPTINAFMNAYPGVQMTLVSVNDVVEPPGEGIDVLVCVGTSPPAGHSVRLVARVELALYASASYLESAGLPHQPRDLATHDIVAFTQSFRGSRFTWQLHNANAQVEIVPSRQPRFRSDDPAAVLGAIAAGQGIGVLPVRFAEHVDAGRTLERVLPGWCAPPTGIHALVADTSSLKTRLFLDLVAEWFRQA